MMAGAVLYLLATITQADPAATAGWPCSSPPPAPSTLAAAWPGVRGGGDWRSDATVAALVGDIAPRNVPQEEAVARIRAFASGNPKRAAAMPRVAAGLVDMIGSEQQLIVTGIRRFNARQAVLANHIEQGYARGDKQRDAVPAGNGPDAAEEQIDWDTRIFEDRQRLLPVMCKLPSMLVERLTVLVAAARESAR